MSDFKKEFGDAHDNSRSIGLNVGEFAAQFAKAADGLPRAPQTPAPQQTPG